MPFLPYVWTYIFVACQYCGLGVSVFLNLFYWEPNAFMLSLCVLGFFTFLHGYYEWQNIDLMQAINKILIIIFLFYLLMELCIIKFFSRDMLMNIGDLFCVMFLPSSFLLNLLILWSKILDLSGYSHA